MSKHRARIWLFVLEGLTSLATAFYGNYVYFLLRDHHAFGNLGNLSVAAFQGLMGSIAAWQGGRFAQRRGYFKSLRIGFAGMAVSLLVGGLVSNLAIQLMVLGGFTIFAALIWPTLQALVSEGETKTGLSRTLGIYNMVWGATAAFSYFFGGALFDHLGVRSIFWLPVTVFVLELFIAGGLARKLRISPHHPGFAFPEPQTRQIPASDRPANPRVFLWMAWLANPFAGLGINTVVATIPGLAHDLNLSATSSGVLCSIWFFARLAAFAGLWHWRKWHYRFRWLLVAFLGLMAGFAAILIGREVWLLVLAQIVFGLCVGFMYCSSLFYSMDVGDTRGEHGGLHEAAMGLGNCIGPATGAVALLVAPQMTAAPGYAVTGFMAIGLVGLVGLRRRFLPRQLRSD